MRRIMLIAATATAAFEAHAQSHIQLYGRAHVGFDTYEAKGAAANSPAATRCGGGACDYASRNRVYDSGSRVGLKGEEDLGPGLKAIFQIDTGVNIDSGNRNGQNGTPNFDTGFWASRDAFVGLHSESFGRLTFGRQSAYWANLWPARRGVPESKINVIGPNYISMGSPLATANFSGVVVGPVARTSNTVQYNADAPVFGGVLGGTITYGIPDTSARPSESIGPAQSAKEKLWAATLRFQHAMFDLQADWGTRYDTNQVVGRDATGWKFGAAWKYKRDAQVSLIFQRLRNANTFGTGLANAVSTTSAVPCSATIPVPGIGPTQATAQTQLYAASLVPGSPAAIFGDQVLAGGGATCQGDTLTQNMWTIQWDHTFGAFHPIAEYSWAGDVNGSSAPAGLPDSGVRVLTIGARYLFSKRTWLVMGYSQIWNDRNNYVDYWGGWNTSASQLGGQFPGLAPRSSGADPRIIRFGISHIF